MPALSIHHASVLVRDLEHARVFFEEILGLRVNTDRPAKSFNGLWYDVGSQQIHLIVSDTFDLPDDPSTYPGARRHVALLVSELALIESRLKAHALPCFPSSSGRPVVFCRDFDGNAFELIDATSLG